MAIVRTIVPALTLLAAPLAGGLSAAAAPAAAEPGIAVVERAPASETTSAEISMQMLKGTLKNASKVDVFAGSQKIGGSIRTDLIEDGFVFKSNMGVKLKLTVSKKAKLTGAYVATAGAFNDLAAVKKAAGVAAGGGSTAAGSTAPPVAKCPYTVAEIETATGLQFRPASAAPSPFAGGVSILCVYQSRDRSSFASLSVDLFQWNTKQDFDQQYPSFKDTMVGKVKPIAGDKDKAAWSERKSDTPQARLEYQRGLAHTTVTLSDVESKVPDLQAKVLKLRRVP